MKGRCRRGAALLLLLALAIPTAVSFTAAADENQPPVAMITLPQNNHLLAPGDLVFLDGRKSFDPDGTIATWRWDLGDGNYSLGAEGSHVYDMLGNHTVTLTVTDSGGQAASTSAQIYVKNPLMIPLEIRPASPASGNFQEGAGISLDTFEGLRVPGGPETERTYLWDFGDGKTSTDPKPKHTYERSGTYNISVTVFQGDLAARTAMQVTVHPAAAPVNNWPWILLAASIVLVVGIAAFLGGTELGLLLLSPVFIFLYSRIRQDRILDNYTRGQIHGYIIANPGEHYSSIRSALDLNNGTLAYHLQRLQNENVIKSALDGTHRRYYPVNMKVPEPEDGALTEVQRLIVAKVSETPGISQRDIGSLMMLSPATVNYHIERLLAKGVIRRERAGMRYRCFVIPPRISPPRIPPGAEAPGVPAKTANEAAPVKRPLQDN